MNWDTIKGQWKQIKGDLRRQWGKLTDDDIEQAGGDREKLEGRIQERYGVAKEDAHRMVDDFLSKR